MISCSLLANHRIGSEKVRFRINMWWTSCWLGVSAISILQTTPAWYFSSEPKTGVENERTYKPWYESGREGHTQEQQALLDAEVIERESKTWQQKWRMVECSKVKEEIWNEDHFMNYSSQLQNVDRSEWCRIGQKQSHPEQESQQLQLLCMSKIRNRRTARQRR